MTSQEEKLYLPPVLKVISENTLKRGNPLGLKDKDCAAWARGLPIPSRGPTILYTGCEYQMTSRLQSLVEVVKKFKFEDGAFAAFRGLQSVTGKLGIDLVKGYTGLAGSDSATYDRILRQAAIVLGRLGVEFACLEGELYSGALLYEFGLIEEFAVQAKKVADQFRGAGASRIITLTPHAAEIFRDIYPGLVPGFRFEVVPYAVALARALEKSRLLLQLREPLTLTLHDPCHLARTLKVTEEPRQVLRGIVNLELKEAERSRQETVCCGAPCEAIYPELSEALATRRVEQLAATGASAAAVLCPFCFSNLTKAARLAGSPLKIVDFIEVVYRALGEEDV